MSVNEDQTWAAQALCASAPPDQLFVQGAAQREVRSICFDCPVRLECLADALDSRASFGVWGGLTERERRAMLRRYPEVKSWVAAQHCPALPLGQSYLELLLFPD